ncbi:hypothetical protein [Thomasclavelia cocleata]|uniref:hypothetical protein n=1 Tax=Thomasclavelia cocleata TaxID=69824 RepID=UPI0025A966DD|nr:hypothetical protein [Thomasclavelia cocleata]
MQQVTDNIHGTIYLSNLESELISTPYFYRLHDIYQSSTVYMTFPSNRTKRYEHSLGTMELASTMLYTAVLNSDIKTKNKLFEKLEEYFKQIYDLAICEYEEQVAPYFKKNEELLKDFFGENGDILSENKINENIENAINEGCFTDSALDYFQYYPMRSVNTSHNSVKNFFLYRCLLQAIRIIALFHDVGHPPYSHIIEDVLNDLLNNIDKNTKNKSNEKVDEFKKCMRKYSKTIKTQTIFEDLSLPDTNSALHERIGLSFLQSAVNDTIPEIIKEVLLSNRHRSCKVASILYYILVVEFAFSMLVERDLFFKSFHKIVDGIMDADRLDYITRDSLNSGVDWGKIPYKRLINSSKLVYLTEFDGHEIEESKRPFVVAFPQKVSDDIEDLLLTRYKIFARINFHHRCLKTATALKASVKILSEDYLYSSNNNKYFNSDINMLWTSLSMKASDRRTRVILWNDSWLISTLYRALININGKSTGQAKLLKENLEEILLNKKRFYSLLKRKKDNQQFLNKIFEYADLSSQKLEILLKIEDEKFLKNKNETITSENLFNLSKANAKDSINRIEEIISDGDVEILTRLIPTSDITIKDIILESLESLKKQAYLADYGIIINNDRKKIGLPRHTDILDEIYLYNSHECYTYDEYNSLKRQIDVIFKNIPWINIYIVPEKQGTDISRLTEKVVEDIARNIALHVKKRFDDLFPNIPNCTQ